MQRLLELIDGVFSGESSEEVFLPEISNLEDEKRILNRVRSHHRKTSNISENWARKASRELVRLSEYWVRNS